VKVRLAALFSLVTKRIKAGFSRSSIARYVAGESRCRTKDSAFPNRFATLVSR